MRRNSTKRTTPVSFAICESGHKVYLLIDVAGCFIRAHSAAHGNSFRDTRVVFRLDEKYVRVFPYYRDLIYSRAAGKPYAGKTCIFRFAGVLSDVPRNSNVKPSFIRTKFQSIDIVSVTEMTLSTTVRRPFDCKQSKTFFPSTVHTPPLVDR